MGRLWFPSNRGYTRMSHTRSPLTMLLETIPPLFHVLLLGLLTYFVVYLNPTSIRWHLLALFIVAQIVANWGFFLANKSIVFASPRNFPGYVHRYPAMTAKDPRAREEPPPAYQLRQGWKECEACDMHVPQRTHHCGHCRRCIYVLDHHCYFLGHCVGRTNLRFFIVFCFYAAVGCAIGVYNLAEVMGFYRVLWGAEAGYYVLPYTLVMYHLGRAAAFELLYVALINFGLGACGACLYLFGSGMRSAFTGRTPHDEKRRRRPDHIPHHLDKPSEDDEDRSPWDCFEDVFGQCGLLHFLLPMVPFEMPKAELGYRRIVTFNNDYVDNGTIRTSETSLDFVP